MQNIIIIINMITAIALIGLVLLQQGKGAEMGASFGGGASQTVFGSKGSGNFFTKMTALLALVFFATSVSLAIIAKNNSQTLAPTPALEQVDGLAEEPTSVAEEAEGLQEGLAQEAEALSDEADSLAEEAEGLAEEVEEVVEEAEGLADPDK